MEIKEIAGQITIVTDGPIKAKPKLPPPTVGPGYLDDLLARLQSKEELPIPKGKPKSSEYTITWVAHREAERLNDPAILPQIAERLPNLKSPDELPDLTFLLTWFIANTQSKAGEKLLAKLLECVPPKTGILSQVFWSLKHTPSAEVRAFALKHIPHKSWDIEYSALEVLIAAANPKDFTFLSKLALSDVLHDCNLILCVEATVATGKKRSIPILKQFIEKHHNNRKRHYRDVVEEAQDALEQLNAGSANQKKAS